MEALEMYSGFICNLGVWGYLGTFLVFLILGYFGLPFFLWMIAFVVTAHGLGAPLAVTLAVLVVGLIFCNSSDQNHFGFGSFNVGYERTNAQNISDRANSFGSRGSLGRERAFSGKPDFKSF